MLLMLIALLHNNTGAVLSCFCFCFVLFCFVFQSELATYYARDKGISFDFNTEIYRMLRNHRSHGCSINTILALFLANNFVPRPIFPFYKQTLAMLFSIDLKKKKKNKTKQNKKHLRGDNCMLLAHRP